MPTEWASVFGERPLGAVEMSKPSTEASLIAGEFLAHPLQQLPGRRWQLVHTRPRQEKALARSLRSRDVPYFLPLVPKVNYIRGRRVRTLSPLFYGYLFAFVDFADGQLVKQTNRIAGMFDVPHQPLIHHELQSLRQLITIDAPLSLERKLEVGRAVRVKSGPLRGAEGRIIQRRGKDRLLVAITFLQQGIFVEVADFQVEPIY